MHPNRLSGDSKYGDHQLHHDNDDFRPDVLRRSITSGVLGCASKPPSASAVPGSTVRFGNDASTPITVVIATPAGSATTLSLDAGGTSAGNVLEVAGAYAVTCRPGGDGQVGRMTISVR